ncbi:hypothetical protein [Clostridium felsineum]|uniref:hypothetical protein n=1 Tax=Clostridium felsineum TaxID=36839 RepID=UPI00098C5375|nr:hypothetical protein [Clostridium felsineum]URZ16895.1 hypothetical protein CLFE_029420 [Clostridium felsineum DSM 794]
MEKKMGKLFSQYEQLFDLSGGYDINLVNEFLAVSNDIYAVMVNDGFTFRAGAVNREEIEDILLVDYRLEPVSIEAMELLTELLELVIEVDNFPIAITFQNTEQKKTENPTDLIGTSDSPVTPPTPAEKEVEIIYLDVFVGEEIEVRPLGSFPAEFAKERVLYALEQTAKEIKADFTERYTITEFTAHTSKGLTIEEFATVYEDFDADTIVDHIKALDTLILDRITDISLNLMQIEIEEDGEEEGVIEHFLIFLTLSK